MTLGRPSLNTCTTRHSRPRRIGLRNGPMADEEVPRLSAGRVRNLTVDELGLRPPGVAAIGGAGNGGGSGGPPAGDFPVPLPEGDDLLERVRALLKQFGGVIFVGPPGTSKSHFAARCA